MSRSSSPLILGDLIIEEVPLDEDEAAEAMPPPGGGRNGPPNACIIRLDSAEAASWPRNPAHFPPPSSSSSSSQRD